MGPDQDFASAADQSTVCDRTAAVGLQLRESHATVLGVRLSPPGPMKSVRTKADVMCGLASLGGPATPWGAPRWCSTQGAQHCFGLTPVHPSSKLSASKRTQRGFRTSERVLHWRVTMHVLPWSCPGHSRTMPEAAGVAGKQPMSCVRKMPKSPLRGGDSNKSRLDWVEQKLKRPWAAAHRQVRD